MLSVSGPELGIWVPNTWIPSTIFRTVCLWSALTCNVLAFLRTIDHMVREQIRCRATLITSKSVLPLTIKGDMVCSQGRANTKPLQYGGLRSLLAKRWRQYSAIYHYVWIQEPQPRFKVLPISYWIEHHLLLLLHKDTSMVLRYRSTGYIDRFGSVSSNGK